MFSLLISQMRTTLKLTHATTDFFILKRQKILLDQWEILPFLHHVLTLKSTSHSSTYFLGREMAL